MSGGKHIWWEPPQRVMQVTCPNCGARYAVDPLAIGPVGRIVQCARCANRWLQTVAAAAAQTAARQAVDDAMSSPRTAPAAGSGSGVDTADVSKPPSFGESAPSLGAARSFEAAEPAPDLVIRPPRQRMSLPAVIAPRKKSRLPVLIRIGVVIVVVAIVAALYFFREPILARMPAEWRAFLHL
jgi:predicted Zn finger-like uncharacterized protein